MSHSPINSQFDIWNEKKKIINLRKINHLFREGEVWIINWGKNIGIEINGKEGWSTRPAVIIRKYNGNHCIFLPLTTKNPPSHVSYGLGNISFLKTESKIILSQIRVISSKRLYRKLGKLSDKVFCEIQKNSAESLYKNSASGA